MTDTVSSEELVDEFLEHHGVLGMKWGVTRQRGNSFDVKAARDKSGRAMNKYRSAQNTASRTHRSRRGEAQDKANELRVAALNNPDRVLAARLTRGEKIAAALLLTPLGAGLLIGATSAHSRRIEYKQDTGAYDKKK